MINYICCPKDVNSLYFFIFLNSFIVITVCFCFLFVFLTLWIRCLALNIRAVVIKLVRNHYSPQRDCRQVLISSSEDLNQGHVVALQSTLHCWLLTFQFSINRLFWGQ